MVATPVKTGPWDLVAVGHFDATSAITALQLLKERTRERTLYEIHSLRVTWSEDGTGDLASFGIADGDVPAGLSNADGVLMGLRNVGPLGGAANPNLYWHWGRSNQLGAGTGDGTIYLPPDFYWAGAMWGIMQNGAGATVTALYTVCFRLVEFSKRDYIEMLNSILPGSATKILGGFS